MSYLPSFPDVPNVPGVPAVLSNQFAAAGSAVNSQINSLVGTAQGALGAISGPIGAGIASINGAISNVQNLVTNGVSSLVNGAFGSLPSALTGDIFDPISSIGGAASKAPKWGIFDQSNKSVLAADSFKSLSFKHGWRVANYPMEQGAFQSYNKVQTPFELSAVFVKGGSNAARAAFLTTIETLAQSLNLYHVVTPEYTYTNVSIEDYDYQRTATNGNKLLSVDIKFIEIKLAPTAAFTNTASASASAVVNGGTVQATAITTAASVTNGLPTNNAQFQTGNAATPNIDPAAASLPTATVTAITSTETPVVAANQSPGAPVAGASFPASGSGGPYVDGNGNTLTYSQANVPGVATYSDRGDGTLIQTVYDSDGTPHFTKVAAPGKVQ